MSKKVKHGYVLKLPGVSGKASYVRWGRHPMWITHPEPVAPFHWVLKKDASVYPDRDSAFAAADGVEHWIRTTGNGEVKLEVRPWRGGDKVTRPKRNPPRGDERLRELERAAQTGGPEQQAAWIRELIRSGKVFREQVGLLAQLGDASANLALGQSSNVTGYASLLGSTQALLDAGPMFCALAGYAVVGGLLSKLSSVYMGGSPVFNYMRGVHENLRQWISGGRSGGSRLWRALGFEGARLCAFEFAFHEHEALQATRLVCSAMELIELDPEGHGLNVLGHGPNAIYATNVRNAISIAELSFALEPAAILSVVRPWVLAGGPMTWQLREGASNPPGSDESYKGQRRGLVPATDDYSTEQLLGMLDYFRQKAAEEGAQLDLFGGEAKQKDPLDLDCPQCGEPAGRWCVSRGHGGSRLKRPHQKRSEEARRSSYERGMAASFVREILRELRKREGRKNPSPDAMVRGALRSAAADPYYRSMLIDGLGLSGLRDMVAVPMCPTFGEPWVWLSPPNAVGRENDALQEDLREESATACEDATEPEECFDDYVGEEYYFWPSTTNGGRRLFGEERGHVFDEEPESGENPGPPSRWEPWQDSISELEWVDLWRLPDPERRRRMHMLYWKWLGERRQEGGGLFPSREPTPSWEDLLREPRGPHGVEFGA